MADTEDVDDFLAHHGVLGMHWGKRKSKVQADADRANAGPSKHAIAKAVVFNSYGSKSRFKDPAALAQRKKAGKLRLAAMITGGVAGGVSTIGGQKAAVGRQALAGILQLGAGAVAITAVVNAGQAINKEKASRS